MSFAEEESILIRKILDGSPEDFRLLIQQYRQLVSHIVSRLLDNGKDQEELGQEIFIKIYNNLSAFQFKSKLSTWIAKIAYNTCLHYLRKKKVPLYDDIVKSNKPDDESTELSKSGIYDVISNDDLPDKIFENKQVIHFVQEEINALPVYFKAVLVFYHLKDMNLQEISYITDLPLNTVKSHLFRARKLLKEKLLNKYTREELCQ